MGLQETVNSKDIQRFYTPESILFNWRSYCSGHHIKPLKSDSHIQVHPSLKFEEPKVILSNLNEPPSANKQSSRDPLGSSYLPRHRVFDDEDEEDHFEDDDEDEEDEEMYDFRDRRLARDSDTEYQMREFEQAIP